MFFRGRYVDGFWFSVAMRRVEGVMYMLGECEGYQTGAGNAE